MDDLISRQAAIAYACSGLIRRMDDEDWIRVADVRESLKEMPSAEQQRTKDVLKASVSSEDLFPDAAFDAGMECAQSTDILEAITDD